MSIGDCCIKPFAWMALDKCDCFIISVEVIRVILGVKVVRFNRAVSAI